MKPRRPSLRARHPAEAAWEPRIAAVEELDHLRGLVDDLDAIAWEAIAATGDFTLVSGGATTIVGYPP
jgi:hypothetical protein